MPHNLDSEPVVIMVPANIVAPVNDISHVEWSDLKNRVADVEGLGLVDLSDVDITGLADGMTLVYDATADTWQAAVADDGAITVGQNWGSPVPVFSDVHSIRFTQGLRVQESGSTPGLVLVSPVFGTSANTVAEGNHAHAQPTPLRGTLAPTGYMGGGTRAIGSATPIGVTLQNGIVYVVEAAVYGQLRGADAGTAYYTLTLNIGDITFTSPGGADGFWCVQGVPDKFHWESEVKFAGTGATVNVSASVAFHSGAGFNVDRTYLRVRLRPER